MSRLPNIPIDMLRDEVKIALLKLKKGELYMEIGLEESDFSKLLDSSGAPPSNRKDDSHPFNKLLLSASKSIIDSNKDLPYLLPSGDNNESEEQQGGGGGGGKKKLRTKACNKLLHQHKQEWVKIIRSFNENEVNELLQRLKEDNNHMDIEESSGSSKKPKKRKSMSTPDVDEDEDGADDDDDDGPPKKKNKNSNSKKKKNVTSKKGGKKKNKKKQEPTKEELEEKEKRRHAKIEEIKEEFLAEKERILSEIPDNYKKEFKQIGFAKWSSSWLPCLFLGPYDIGPGPVRDQWMDMFEKTGNLHRRQNMSRLVFWYGEETLQSAFSFVSQSGCCTYEKGLSKNLHKQFLKIEEKIANGKKLSKKEQNNKKSWDSLQDHLKKDPSDRQLPMAREHLKEDYEALLDGDIMLEDEEEDFVEEEDVSEKEEEEEEEEVPPPKKRGRKPKKDKDVSKKKKKKRKEENTVEEHDDEMVGDDEVDDEEEIGEDDDDDDEDVVPDEDDEVDDDYEEESSKKKKKQTKTDSTKKKPGRKKKEDSTNDSSSSSKKVSAGRKKGPKRLEQEAFEECERIFIPIIQKWKNGLSNKDINVIQDALKDTQKKLQVLTAPFIEEYGFAALMKNETKGILKEADSKNTDSNAPSNLDTYREVWHDMRILYEQKKDNVPEGFIPKKSKKLLQPSSKSNKAEKSKSQKQRQQEEEQEQKPPKTKVKPPAGDTNEKQSNGEKAAATTKTDVKHDEEKVTTGKVPKKTDFQKPTDNTANATSEATAPAAVAVEKKTKKSTFSLSNLMRPKPKQESSSIKQDQKPSGGGKSIGVTATGSSVSAGKVGKAEIPSWLTREPPVDSSSTISDNKDRTYALEFYNSIASKLSSSSSSSSINHDGVARTLEDEVYKWATGKYGDTRWTGPYWEKTHSLVGAICGKGMKGNTKLIKQILNGVYPAAKDIVIISDDTLQSSYESA